VESLGKFWLLSIEDAGWRPPAGEHVAEIGPLPVIANKTYSAQYMEAIFTPGMLAATHTQVRRPGIRSREKHALRPPRGNKSGAQVASM
jgi:hypothetical protein